MSLFTLGSARAVLVVALVYFLPDVFNVINHGIDLPLHKPAFSFIVSIRWTRSFLKTTLANGVKVVKKVITSKFRFHLIAIYALGCFRNFICTPVPTKITLKSTPNPLETSERMNFNVIDKKQLIWKLFIYGYLMSFFHKKKCQKMFGPPLCHLDQWLIFYWPKNKIWASQNGPHFRHCIFRSRIK